MREIIFRGKRIDTGEWVYGNFVLYEHMGEVKHIIVTDWAQVYVNSHFVIPETVGQDTGLKDKNGKEIYEGDIIEKTYYSYHQPECSELFEIKYEGLSFHFEHIKGSTFHLPFTEDIEIIGNIHDNPELVEGERVEVRE